jgi:DNA mismatch repair ATPase MutS
MQNPLDFYTREKEKFSNRLKIVNKKLKTFSFIRLIFFIIIITLIYVFWGNSRIVIAIILLGFILFAFLVNKYNDLKDKKEKIKQLLIINQTEITVLKGDYSSLDDGNEFIDPKHFYSFDIDLFGKGSFFQYLNRTATRAGKMRLAQILTENSISEIIEKQNAIKELSLLPAWRQNFTAIAKLVKVDTRSKTIVEWIQNYQCFTSKIFQYIPGLFSIISFGLIILSFINLVSFSIVSLWFFVGLIITSVYFKKINTLYKDANKAKSTFKQYHKLLLEIETVSVSSKLLVKTKSEIQSKAKSASLIFVEFSKVLDAFDQRNNMIFGLLGNGFLLWDLHQSSKIEKWIDKYHLKVKKWFEVISFFDSYNSLSNYYFNHPKHVSPILLSDKNLINALKLGHPLIEKEKLVTNDITIKNRDFEIITGANMAGKSTFLRTVSLSIVLSNIGLPVCAKSFEYFPIKLITSMRTSDNLSEDTSYFFSELKRLKFIVNNIKADKFFIVLDEILKGTNSEDKAIGSKKFIEKLVRSGSSGMVATHDLSLCEIEKDFEQINNHYFDAEVINNELYFDFKLKKGICKNMNASFLLKKMEIV